MPTLNPWQSRRTLRTRCTRCVFTAMRSQLPDAALKTATITNCHQRACTRPALGHRLRGHARVGLPFRTRPYSGGGGLVRPLDFSNGTKTHHRPKHQRAVLACSLCARAARLPSQFRCMATNDGDSSGSVPWTRGAACVLRARPRCRRSIGVDVEMHLAPKIFCFLYA